MGIEELLYGFAEVLKRRTDVQLIIGGLTSAITPCAASVADISWRTSSATVTIFTPRRLPIWRSTTRRTLSDANTTGVSSPERNASSSK